MESSMFPCRAVLDDLPPKWGRKLPLLEQSHADAIAEAVFRKLERAGRVE